MDGGPNPTAVRAGPRPTTLALATFALITAAAAAAPGPPVDGEAAVFSWANGFPTWVGAPLQALGLLGTSIVAVVTAVTAVVVRRVGVALDVLGAWAATRLASSGVKLLVDRDRPPVAYAEVVVRQHVPFDSSFPSAHAATAAALAVAVAATWPRWRWPAALGAVLIGVSRMYVGVHHPLDLVGGWALGVLFGTLGLLLSRRLRARRRTGP